jgi:hypothetical protein
MRPWRVRPADEGLVARLAAQARLRPLTARILVSRGHGDLALVGRFLAPRLADLRPPQGIADLDRALDRLGAALQSGQRIGVFGDYDVDGVTTAAVLTLALRALGGTVVPRVASRSSGYGLSPADAARFADEGCQVVVTGDCGTSDHEAIARCQDRGRRRDRHRSPPGAGGPDPGPCPHQSAPGGRSLPLQGAGLVRGGLLPGGRTALAPARPGPGRRRGLRSAAAPRPGGAGDPGRPGAPGRREPDPGGRRYARAGPAPAPRPARADGSGRAGARAARHHRRQLPHHPAG